MTESKQSRRFFYGWVILAVGVLALIVSNGLAIYGIPVFYKWIREDFVASGAVDATKAESFIAFGATLTFWVAGISSPLLGWLIQKFNLRILMITGCVILGGGLLLHSQATSPSAVYSARILMGISLGLVGVLPSTILVSNWFVKNRGTALGILLTGTSFGGIVIPQIANPLIEKFGWRSAMMTVSLIIWVILLPAIIFLVKNQPGDIGLFPDGDTEKTEEKEDKDLVSTNDGMSLSEAIKTPIFWILALCSCLVFYPIFVTGQQFILYLQTPKIGLTAQQGGYALSVLAAVSVGGKSIFGFLSDKNSPTCVMLICCSLMFLATLILFSLTAGTAFIFLIMFGLGYGGTFVLLQRQVADYFGNRDYPKILGVITIVETSGAAIGGIITGRLADAAGGDYTNAFYAVIVVTGLALTMTVLLNILVRKNKVATI